MAKTYGYIRISSKDQNRNRQLAEMIDKGIPQENIFSDIASGKDFNREEYAKLLKVLKKGDTLIVKSIDRLGRNYDHILQEWQNITKNIGANIKVIDIPLLDTSLTGKDLTGAFICDLVLQILSYVAQQERENIKQRQREGIAIAKLQGKHLGRPKAELPINFVQVYTDWESKVIDSKTAMQMLGLKRTTFYNMVNRYKKQKADN